MHTGRQVDRHTHILPDTTDIHTNLLTYWHTHTCVQTYVYAHIHTALQPSRPPAHPPRLLPRWTSMRGAGSSSRWVRHLVLRAARTRSSSPAPHCWAASVTTAAAWCGAAWAWRSSSGARRANAGSTAVRTARWGGGKGGRRGFERGGVTGRGGQQGLLQCALPGGEGRRGRVRGGGGLTGRGGQEFGGLGDVRGGEGDGQLGGARRGEGGADRSSPHLMPARVGVLQHACVTH